MSPATSGIDLLSSHHGTGASENLWLETALWLKSQGLKVHTAMAWNEVDSPRRLPLLEANIECRALRQHWAMSTLGRRLLNTADRHQRVLSHWLGRRRPALVLVSQGNDHSALPWLQALEQLGIPAAVVTHGINAADWPDDSRAAALRKAFAGLRASFWVSRRNADDFERQLGQSLGTRLCAFNPLKVPRHALPWPEADTPLRLACVARLQTRPKGHDLLLEAMATEACRQLPVRLSFFGRGENREGLQRLCQRLGLEQRVEFHGHQDDVSAIWQTHHLLAQPSRNEGMPLSLIEAMACGRGALATDVAGHSELIKEGVTGFLAPCPCVADLAAALQRACEARQHLQAMGFAALRQLEDWMPAQPVAHFGQQLIDLAKP